MEVRGESETFKELKLITNRQVFLFRTISHNLSRKFPWKLQLRLPRFSAGGRGWVTGGGMKWGGGCALGGSKRGTEEEEGGGGLGAR